MALSALQQRLAPLGISFALPSAEGMRVDLSEQELQLLLLAGLSAIADASGAGGVERAAPITTATGNGTVAAGAKGVIFIFSPDFSGTVSGGTFTGSVDNAYSLPVLPGGDTYGAIAYTVTTGSIRITRIA